MTGDVTRDRVNNFLLGFKKQFPSLEEALTHPDSERKLINLRDADVRYDARQHAVYYQRNGKTTRLPLDPAFRNYMRKYGHKTYYVTDKGTPWLTRTQEHLNPNPDSDMQTKAYYDALCRGMNQEVVMVTWTDTELLKKETGHSALSVGSLNPVDGSGEMQDVPIYDYIPEITGSYYGSTTPFLGAKHAHEYRKDSQARLVGSDPAAHAKGVTTRDGMPIFTSLAAGILASIGTMVVSSRKLGEPAKAQRKILKNGLAAASILSTASIAAISSGLLVDSSGTLLMKEEMQASGLLASLITPAQRDIMEHSLYGVYLTYHEKYNMLNSNCADFSEKMLHDINLDLTSIVKEAMQQQPKRTFAERIRNPLAIPAHIQPSRNSWALRSRNLPSVEVTLEPTPEGEEKKRLGMRKPDKKGGETPPHEKTRAFDPKKDKKWEHIRRRDHGGEKETVKVSFANDIGASSVMVESTGKLVEFRQPPIETFREVMKQALTLRQNGHGQCRFDFQPHIKQQQKEQSANHAR